MNQIAKTYGDAHVWRAMTRAERFLKSKTASELLKMVGKTVKIACSSRYIDKAVIQGSYGGGKIGPTDDLLAGNGLFYITEQGKLYLDCTAGHYQMTWGYNHPQLTAAILRGIQNGIITDNHSNIPQWPVKRLAQKLVQLANPDLPELREGDFSKIIKSKTRLNTVLLGIATGSVACSSALKIMLSQHERLKKPGPAVMVVLKGNYHGTDMIAQNLRGMWKRYVRNIKVVTVEPNDYDSLKKVFERYGSRIAGFWAEPVMMNREAILIEKRYLQLARRLTTRAKALLAIDEIQTCFWTPDIFMFKQYGIVPDIVIIGKGMTAGFHPLAAIIYRRPLDMLAQYDSISTNGNAALAAYVALANLELIEKNAENINVTQKYYQQKLRELARNFPERIATVNGQGLLTGLKFHRREDALLFHKKCLAAGLWLRIHAYYPEHSTILCKFALAVTKKVVDAFCRQLQRLLESTD